MSQTIASDPTTGTAQRIAEAAQQQLLQRPPLDREPGSPLVIHIPLLDIDSRSLALLENGHIDLDAQYDGGRMQLMPGAHSIARTHQAPVAQANSLVCFTAIAEQVTRLMDWLKQQQAGDANYWRRLNPEQLHLAWRQRPKTLLLTLFRA